MDNITHSLTGLALARLGLNRLSPRATLLLVLSANVPDVDIVVLTRGPLPYLEAHRGYSHSLLGLPVMALIAVLVVAAIYRERLPWARAWGLCCIGVGSHLLMDSTNSFGVRLLLPFSSSWFHLDLNSLFDAWILAVLVFAAVWPVFARMVNREIGAHGVAGRGTAVFALAFFALFDGGRAILRARAVAQLEARLWDEMPPVNAAALPQPFTPFRWSGVVESSKSYRAIPVNTLGQLDPATAKVFYKPPAGPTLDRAKATEPFRYFLYFARFPVWSLQPVLLDQGKGTRVDLADLRFGAPGTGSFHCIALENSRHQVLQSVFTYGSGWGLGWGQGRPPISVGSLERTILEVSPRSQAVTHYAPAQSDRVDVICPSLHGPHGLLHLASHCRRAIFKTIQN